MSELIFKRDIYNELLEWRKSNGAYAVLIEGARRIGKTTLAKAFALNEYKSYIYIDFSNTSEDVKSLFKDLTDLDRFFFTLSFLFGVTLYERDSVIIFDEVQLYPLARQAIKHLVKDGRYDYIETGSLISIKENVKDILIPSEEHSLHMHPMSLKEFCEATGVLNVELLEKAYSMKRPLGDSVNREWMKQLRLYMLVGGMPQAVKTYIDTNSLIEVDKVKREILELYFKDLAKIDSKIPDLLKSIPSQLALNSARFRARFVYPKSNNIRQYKALDGLIASRCVNCCYFVIDPNLGLAGMIDPDKFKLYLLDTGLFVTLAYWNEVATNNELYTKLLLDKLPSNLGYVYENLVAQMLTARGKKLYYHIFKEKKDSSNNSEIDFIIIKGNKVCPIEVKSSSYKTHASIDAFSRKYHERVGEKIIIYTKDYKKDGDITYMPAYFTELLN